MSVPSVVFRAHVRKHSMARHPDISVFVQAAGRWWCDLERRDQTLIMTDCRDGQVWEIRYYEKKHAKWGQVLFERMARSSVLDEWLSAPATC
jgi:hypothetical protein